MHNEAAGHSVIPLKYFNKESIWRIIPSRFPPINLFERVSSKEDWEILNDIASLTNDRLRDEVGKIELVPQNERIYGSGAGYIMAAFTHLNPSWSRFSDGTYGVYYAGNTLNCAIEETKYHRAKFLKFTDTPAIDIEMRVLLADLTGNLHNIADKPEEFGDLYDPSNYSHSQIFAKELKLSGSFGIYYLSVGHLQGYCYAIFKPNIIQKCRQERHLVYRWDGDKISNIFEIKERKLTEV